MKRIAILLVAVFLMLFSSVSSAYVYIDEDFEGDVAFLDRNWPVQSMDTMPTTASVSVKGTNLRNILDWQDHLDPKVVIQTSGSVVSSRHFLGSHSLRLGSSQFLKLAPQRYIGWNIRDFRLFQFALGFTSATAQLTPGKSVGFFRSDWSTVTSGTTAGSFYLDFIPSADHRIDIVCSNTARTIATVSAGQGNWALISVLASVRRASPTEDYQAQWVSYDPFKHVYKGPRTYREPAQYPLLSCGISVFVNSASPSEAAFIPADAIAPGWGGNDADDDGMLNTNEIGWEIGSRNGGTLFVDNVYWDSGYHATTNEGYDLEQAARMLEFDQLTNEQTPHTRAEGWPHYR